MANESSIPRTSLVDAARWNAIIYGPDMVGHSFPALDARDDHHHVAYIRQPDALGKGMTGNVFLEHTRTAYPGVPVNRAVKKMAKSLLIQKKIDWRREIEALVLLRESAPEDLFVSFYGWYEDPATVFLAFEYLPLGDLSQYIKQINTEDEVRSIASQVVAALCVMHHMNIVHRDLKPGNILVASYGPCWKVKLADFGSSKRLHEDTELRTITYTAAYMAPEYAAFMRDDTEYPSPTPAVDLWAVGCILYELYTKEQLFGGERSARRLEEFCKKPEPLEALVGSFASNSAQAALLLFLDPDPSSRLAADDAMIMHWLAEEQSSSSSMIDDAIGLWQTVCEARTFAGESSTSQHPEPLDMPPSNASTISLATTVTPDDTSYLGDNLTWAKDLGLRPPLPPRRSSAAHPSDTESLTRAAEKAVDEEFVQSTHTDHISPPLAGSKSAKPYWSAKVPVVSESKEPEAFVSEGYSAEYEIASPQVTCSYLIHELRMSIGPLEFQSDPLPVCDVCAETTCTVGPRANNRFKSLLYRCEGCGKDRLLCESCARKTINLANDPHEADHMLRRKGPAISFYFEHFFKQPHIVLQMRENVPQNYGSGWMQSNHDFIAPDWVGARSLRAHLSLKTPPGIYNISVHLQITFDPARTTSEALGSAQKKWMRLSKEPFGYLSVGAETFPNRADFSTKLYDQFMPSDNVVQPITCATSRRYDLNVTISLKKAFQVLMNERLIVSIKSWHDPEIFKSGCPFRWHLVCIGLSQYGDRVPLATKGQLIRRDQFLRAQKDQQQRDKLDRHLATAGNVLGLGTKAYGLANAAANFNTRRAQRIDHEWSAVNSMVSATNGLMRVDSPGDGPYYHKEPAFDPRIADTRADSEGQDIYGTEQWVADQNSHVPFVASFDAVW